MIKKISYIADDGKTFEDEDKCLNYEQQHIYDKKNIKNDLFCFNEEDKRYFPITYSDFEELKSFFCKTQEAYEVLRQLEENVEADFLPFEECSVEPYGYDKETVPILNAHWVYEDDEWVCLEYEAKKISDAILLQQNLIDAAKES